ncbi:hypothetical protein CLV63_101497 [Murinocardiopsis flavida]|uniref:ATPase AAA-type core domain-containing protein n=2 Tax=Murinocardiopsis flavida TaxID=645275 RepID=A0A2P8DUW9_9ACTN|nr:hypothetical protein CLV63_101497 [Murinocardiopsis flavida]
MSFGAEVDLTMVLPSMRTNHPTNGSWIDWTTRVAAIYGPNASGKSGIVDALRYMKACVASSPTWAKRGRFPRTHFALDENSRDRPSSFALDFVLNSVRHEYGFSISSTRVEEEWLYTFPTGRKRVVFEREPGANGMSFGRELGGGGSDLRRTTTERELLLSRAALTRHHFLEPIHDCIVNGIDIAQFGESDRKNRLRSVIQDVSDGSLSLDDLRTMLRVADIGIIGAEVAEGETDPRVLRLFRALLEVELDVGDEEVDDNDIPSDEQVEEIFTTLARSLKFKHVGKNDQIYSLASSAQSTGTLTWLSLAAPAIGTIRRGGVLAVDELDASLHPQLAQVMIQMFRDDSVNTTGAQLIFTTHDTYFISPSSNSRLSPEEVWFVEKERNGISDLYRLSDFQTRKDQNLSRRYLQGRYGAVPSVAPSFLAALASSNNSNEQDRELV